MIRPSERHHDPLGGLYVKRKGCWRRGEEGRGEEGRGEDETKGGRETCR